jgi:signal transduction histidine kinase
VTEGLLYIDAVRSLSEPTFIVTSDGMLSDANFAGLKMVGLTTVGHNVCLSSLVDNDTVEVMEFLHFWAGSRSSMRGNMVWRTPNGPQARELTAWCARPPYRSGPALVAIRCDSKYDADDRATRWLLALSEQVNSLKEEVVARGQVERGLAGALKARDDFAGIAAHELRNPLNVFHLTLQLLYRMPHLSGADIRKMLDKLRVQLNRINSLVDHLLDGTRIRAGKLELELERFDLGDLIGEVVHRFAELHPDTLLMFRVDGAAAGIWDRVRIEQAVASIISNAIKYGTHKPITVVVSVEHSEARIAVQNQGGGIAPADHERIFDRFERAIPQSNTEGLGLWIAKRVVEAHGGRMFAEGQEGRGVLFTVHLPLGAG